MWKISGVEAGMVEEMLFSATNLGIPPLGLPAMGVGHSATPDAATSWRDMVVLYHTERQLILTSMMFYQRVQCDDSWV